MVGSIFALNGVVFFWASGTFIMSEPMSTGGSPQGLWWASLALFADPVAHVFKYQKISKSNSC